MHYSMSHIHFVPNFGNGGNIVGLGILNESSISHADVRDFSQAQGQCEYYEYIPYHQLYFITEIQTPKVKGVAKSCIEVQSIT